MRGFIGEDDLTTFAGWLRYRAIDASMTSPEEMATLRRQFAEAMERRASSPKLGTMSLRQVPGEHRYAVAVRDGAELWLTLWVRRSRKGEFFVFLPRGDGEWNPHTSYHLDGRLHSKSYDEVLHCDQRQPLTGVFRGTEPLGVYGGYFAKSVGAICDPAAFYGVIEVPPGVLGPCHGGISVDLVEPGCDPIASSFASIAKREVFRHCVPWIVVTVGS
jgi:hypothetical protein